MICTNVLMHSFSYLCVYDSTGDCVNTLLFNISINQISVIFGCIANRPDAPVNQCMPSKGVKTSEKQIYMFL